MSKLIFPPFPLLPSSLLPSSILPHLRAKLARSRERGLFPSLCSIRTIYSRTSVKSGERERKRRYETNASLVCQYVWAKNLTRGHLKTSRKPQNTIQRKATSTRLFGAVGFLFYSGVNMEIILCIARHGGRSQDGWINRNCPRHQLTSAKPWSLCLTLPSFKLKMAISANLHGFYTWNFREVSPPASRARIFTRWCLINKINYFFLSFKVRREISFLTFRHAVNEMGSTDLFVHL